MWSLDKILVATDFGEPSRAAADLALELAQRFDASVTLVHAYTVPASVYAGIPLVPIADYVQAFDEAARDQLAEEGARLAGRGAAVSTVLRVGIAWEEVLAVAKELGCGLIVIGTHGRRGLPRAILGSVAEKVVRLSPVPVLTVHQPAADAARSAGPAFARSA